MTLLSMSIQAGVMIIIITLVRSLAINRLPKKTFLALWGIVLLRLLIPFSLPSPFSVYSFANLNGLTLPAAAAALATSSPLAHIPQNTGDVGILSIPPWGLIWGIGAAICALYFILAYVRCRREFALSQSIDNDYTIEWLTQPQHVLKRTIQIRQSSRISAPLTYDVFRPVILLSKQPTGRTHKN